MVQAHLLTRQRKDPKDANNYQSICENCNFKYLQLQMILPFLKNAEKLRKLSVDREDEYNAISKDFNKIYTELQQKNAVVSER